MRFALQNDGRRGNVAAAAERSCARPMYARLNPASSRSNQGTEQEHTMLALGIIFGFIAVIAAFNVFEFGRVD
ncbi:hypothetical protein [Brevundimonas sp.]|uniref:hypothetical protein n=1 Tax=Brevundimonas sp. TaxID=1871086 RepID=UPI0025B8F1B0|nr:hypothetical protein [Brevundimonas sp.]